MARRRPDASRHALLPNRAGSAELRKAAERRRPMVMATLATSSFDFLAFGGDEDEALALLRLAWLEHQRQTGAWLEWDVLAEDVTFKSVAIGHAYRHGDAGPMDLSKVVDDA